MTAGGTNGEGMVPARLSGKVCIITGTGGSIGREAAFVFASEGACVVGCDLNAEAAEATVQMVRNQGGTMVSLHPCRLSKPADCKALVDLAVGTFSRIDVLFNNAAMAYFNWLEDITDEEWDRNRRDEVDLVFYLTRAAWPHLKGSRGVVVNTASLTASLSFRNLPSLGGHLKTGHGWTGQNRPPGERPRLVISIPRLPRDANRAGPWCASCAGRT